jgi:hypothetical protein
VFRHLMFPTLLPLVPTKRWPIAVRPHRPATWSFSPSAAIDRTDRETQVHSIPSACPPAISSDSRRIGVRPVAHPLRRPRRPRPATPCRGRLSSHSNRWLRQSSRRAKVRNNPVPDMGFRDAPGLAARQATKQLPASLFPGSTPHDLMTCRRGRHRFCRRNAVPQQSRPHASTVKPRGISRRR